MRPFFFLSLGMTALFACQAPSSDVNQSKKEQSAATLVGNKPSRPTRDLDKYWSQGKAEINRYALQQSRYRDQHPGEVVMLFVKEDFLTDKQVKNEQYTNPNSVPILKSNSMRTFNTGIYTYDVMTSVFTPYFNPGSPRTIKISHSSQDWCGQTYTQVNDTPDGYQVTLHSYFEQEADAVTNIDHALLEDEIFCKLRIDPATLPLGKIKAIPSLTYFRFMHVPIEVREAEATLSAYKGDTFSGQNLKVYRLQYAADHVFEIVFQSQSPFLIEGWKEFFPGRDGKPSETIAKRTHTLLDNYWAHNNRSDAGLRGELGLE